MNPAKPPVTLGRGDRQGKAAILDEARGGAQEPNGHVPPVMLLTGSLNQPGQRS